ncbi:MAG: AraC family transcriptional regulator [Armatimonadetes bacterium]|nr:AraC family transcriptional regulator [Armatimonadota bacterium]
MTGDLAFLHCAHNPHCAARVDKHFEGYASLQWMEAGAIELFYGDERFELRASPKTTWFWPAFEGPRIRFHLARETHTWNHRYAAFTGARLESWKRAGLWPQKPQIGPRGEEHRAQFDELLALIQRGGTWGTRRAIHALEALLLELAEARAASSVEAPWLAQTRDFLARTGNFSPDYTLLARELGLGLSTLRRNFKSATGLSLHEALLQNRLDSARRLLGETTLPLKQIATQLGYRDVYFFSNQFKQLSGVSPAAYRRSRQG